MSIRLTACPAPGRNRGVLICIATVAGKERGAMRSKLLNVDPPVTYAVASLTRFAREQEIEAASVTGIGAFLDAVLGYFDWRPRLNRDGGG